MFWNSLLCQFHNKEMFSKQCEVINRIKYTENCKQIKNKNAQETIKNKQISRK